MVRKHIADIMLVRGAGKWLCYCGWSLFVLSMFLPVIGPIFSNGPFPGWYCAFTALLSLWPGSWSGSGLYMASFGLTNILMAASPLLLRRSMGGGPVKWIVPVLLAVSTADVLSLAGSTWHIGYYAWLASYVLVTAGSLALLAAQRRNIPRIEVPERPRMRSDEELAAERELETYLCGVHGADSLRGSDVPVRRGNII